METAEEDIYYCSECDTKVKRFHRFCHHCGVWMGADSEQVSIFNNSQLRSAFFFYTIYLFVCLTVKFTGWFSSYDLLFYMEIFLAIVTLIFVRKNWKTIKPLLRFNNFSVPVLAGVIVVSFIFSFLVNISINQINISVFRVSTNLFDPYKIYQAPVLIMIYSIAFMPGIFEELAFRGVLYNYFNTFLDERMVVMVTGFVFAAIHLNFFSLVWLVPFGILVGSLRRKYNTLWYGIIFHFVFNLTACLIDLYRDGILV
ncbi:hypothetical protein BH11BAC6_BH11BAC6_07520 [soil metagenome]